MEIITAPEESQKDHEIILFLAGGISKCSDWQTKVLGKLSKRNVAGNILVCNPRRSNFAPQWVADKNITEEQIKWEFKYLSKMNLFTMYFDYSEESDQPICFYELGRYISQIMIKFPNDYQERIVISFNEKFKRKLDVIYQVALATDKKVIPNEVDPENHEEKIMEKINTLLKKKV